MARPAGRFTGGAVEPSPLLRYIDAMFEVLAFVYENYWRRDSCPEGEPLGRKLSAHGFEVDEIDDALRWLDGLRLATQGVQLRRHPDPPSATAAASAALPRVGVAAWAQSHDAMRVYSTAEQDHLGGECLGFISFLASAGALPPGLREVVIERAMAAPGGPVCLDELKIMMLMVHWSSGTKPDALMLGELRDEGPRRLAH